MHFSQKVKHAVTATILSQYQMYGKSGKGNVILYVWVSKIPSVLLYKELWILSKSLF